MLLTNSSIQKQMVLSDFHIFPKEMEKTAFIQEELSDFLVTFFKPFCEFWLGRIEQHYRAYAF